jgi:hypothetical protein
MGTVALSFTDIETSTLLLPASGGVCSAASASCRRAFSPLDR